MSSEGHPRNGLAGIVVWDQRYGHSQWSDLGGDSARYRISSVYSDCDEVFWCDDDAGCPSGMRCIDHLCRR